MVLANTTEPTAAELRLFGVVMAAMGAVLGTVLFYAGMSVVTVASVVTIGMLLCCVYYVVPSTRYPLYSTWMAVIAPLGWVMSHALFGVIYFGVITPIAMLLRFTGRDPLRLLRAAAPESHWIPLDKEADKRRYFRQF